ncbi:MMPL family transporter [Nocardioides sp. cx-169]|uniref:MMPL family transporter n=1 Tax=Nocardioides sp. cx-169 TaxID=2899080 RepID=UPI001E48BD61|nr:MMPL family transporter [Nocardioides sp. cx-169]MCD4535365.1 MMPL family transporter [Nocardioides sp. cx-169]
MSDRPITADRPSPSAMERLASFAQRHRWSALLVWVAVLGATTFAGQAVGSSYDNDFTLPGTQSQEMAELLEENAPARSGDAVTVVVHDRRGWDAGLDQAALTGDLSAVDHVEEVTGPEAGLGTVSEDGTTALVEVALEGAQGDTPRTTFEDLIDVAETHRGEQTLVELSGNGIRQVESGGGGMAEGVGLLAALVILVLMFGSVLAACLPLITALLAVGSMFGVAALLSHVLTIPDFSTAMLALVGLGVGIDYALLIFTRYRSELLSGADPAQATRTALDTAGRSVLFAGASVMIALGGLFTLGVDAYEGSVTAVALTVLTTMLASLTLLPALLGLFGARIERRIRKHAVKGKRESGRSWRRWAALVQRRPWLALASAVSALAALAVPAVGMQLGFSDAGTDEEGTTSRAAYELISKEFGPGANGRMLVLTEGTQARAQATAEALRRAPGIVADRVSPPAPVGDGLFLTWAEPTTGPQDEATAELVTTLRDDLGDGRLVGGATATYVDFSAEMAERFPIFVGVVIVLSGLLLVLVFRSVWIPVKAAVFNVLSIGAAFGVLKLVFQDGSLGAQPGPIEAFLPVFVFAIVFGLSMDYEVFLISRMREEWLRTGDARAAVREGIAHTGGVITAAAAIMVMVFGSFVLSPDRMLQEMGLAMAVAVLLDALVIRCLAVPAAMRLLGARAWWLPRWLERALPRLDVEGAAESTPSPGPVPAGHG